MTDKALIVNLIGYKNKEKRNDGEFQKSCKILYKRDETNNLSCHKYITYLMSLYL